MRGAERNSANRRKFAVESRGAIEGPTTRFQGEGCPWYQTEAETALVAFSGGPTGISSSTDPFLFPAKPFRPFNHRERFMDGSHTNPAERAAGEAGRA